MTHLKVGDQAPEITGKDQEGNAVSLNQYAGKKLVLYFYPKDMTPGCTKQGCNLRDNYDLLRSEGFEILGVSADSEKSHRKFIDKHELPFRLLADEDKTVINAYGVWGPKKFMGRVFDGIHRVTFVVDEQGTIIDIIEKVKTADHTTQILDRLKEKTNG